MYLSYCWLDRTGVKYYKHTWWQAGKKQHKGVCQLPASSKSRLPKQGHLVCPNALGKIFDFFNLWQNLFQQQTSHLHVVMKKIENFPEKSYFSRSKINWLIFFVQFLGLNEKLQRSERLSFSSRSFAAPFCPHSYSAHVWRTLRQACLQVNALVETMSDKSMSDYIHAIIETWLDICPFKTKYQFLAKLL